LLAFNIVCSLSWSVFLIYLFSVSWLHGFRVTVLTDHFGEFPMEFGLLLFAAAMGIGGLWVITAPRTAVPI
jgi:hypothetical protein